jgi:hypothetical protein
MGSLVGSLGSMAGTAIGGAVGGPIGAQIGGSLGGALGSTIAGGSKVAGAKAAGRITDEAARALAEAQRTGRGLQASASRFTPLGVSSRFGSPQYGIDPTTGQLTSIGYNLDPALIAQREQFLAAMPGQLESALGYGAQSTNLANQLFGMGQTTLGQVNLDPTQAAQERVARLDELRAPGRAESAERLFSNLASKGLTGLVTETGTGARVNPYEAARQESIERQRAQDVISSYDQARSDIGTDLQRAYSLISQSRGAFGGLSDALSPYTTSLAQAQGIEGIGQSLADRGIAQSDLQRRRNMEEAGYQYQQLVDPQRTLSGMADAQASRKMAEYAGYGDMASGLLNAQFQGQQMPGVVGTRQNTTGVFAPIPGVTAPYALPGGSTFTPGSAAYDYQKNFQFQPISMFQSTAAPNYAPPTFNPQLILQDPSINRTRPIQAFGAGASQPLFISP